MLGRCVSCVAVGVSNCGDGAADTASSGVSACAAWAGGAAGSAWLVLTFGASLAGACTGCTASTSTVTGTRSFGTPGVFVLTQTSVNQTPAGVSGRSFVTTWYVVSVGVRLSSLRVGCRKL